MSSVISKAAYEIPDFYVGVLEANSDLSAAQYKPVDAIAASGAGVMGPAALALCADHVPMLGILQNAPVLAEAGQVMVHGVSKAQAGGTFVVGDRLMVASGKLVKATTGFYAVAKALEAGSAGIVVSVLLMNYGIEA